MGLQPPAGIVERVRALCLALPETREEQPWVGVRGTVHRQNFAQAVRIEDGRRPMRRRQAATDR